MSNNSEFIDANSEIAGRNIPSDVNNVIRSLYKKRPPYRLHLLAIFDYAIQLKMQLQTGYETEKM